MFFSRRYEIYSLSIEQKSLLYLTSDWISTQTFSCSRHEPRECSQSFAVTLNIDFIKWTISQPRRLEVSSFHLFLQSLYINLWSILLGPLSNDSIHQSKPFWGPGFLESRPTCTEECQCGSLVYYKSRLDLHCRETLVTAI